MLGRLSHLSGIGWRYLAVESENPSMYGFDVSPISETSIRYAMCQDILVLHPAHVQLQLGIPPVDC